MTRGSTIVLALGCVTLAGCMEWDQFVCETQKAWQIQPLQFQPMALTAPRLNLLASPTWRGTDRSNDGRAEYTLDTNSMSLRIQTYDLGSSLILDNHRDLTVLERRGTDVVYAFVDEVDKPGFNPGRDALTFRPGGADCATLISSQGMWRLAMQRD